MIYVSESFGSSPVITSADLPWQGVRVEQYCLDAMTLPAHYHAHHLLLLYQVARPILVQHEYAGQVEQKTFRTNDLGLHPADEYGPVVSNAPSDNIYLTIDPQYIERLAGDDLSRFALRQRFHFTDPLLCQLGRQLLATVGSKHALGLLYVESLLNALCHQLIEHHATGEQRIAKGRLLTKSVLTRIDAYVEAHAEVPITLQTLASLANLSLFHFARLFKQTTGVSPYQHVLTWKIRRAKDLLRADDTPVADISDGLGFATPANFSTAFRRVVGRSPVEFRQG